MMSDVIRLSASGVRAFRSCNYRYARDYVDRLPGEERDPVSAFALGDAIHKAIAAFFRNGGWARQSLVNLLAHLDRYWDASVYHDPISAHLSRKRAEEMLSRFHEVPYPAEVEQDLGSECRAAWDSPRKGILATGRLDRVCLLSDSMLEVIDYKTGLWRLTPEQLKEDLQAVFYRTLAAARFRDFEPSGIRITFYYLMRATPVSVTFEREEFVRRWQKVEAIGERITRALVEHRSGRPRWEAFPLNRGDRCRSCSIRRHCDQVRPSGPDAETGTSASTSEECHAH